MRFVHVSELEPGMIVARDILGTTAAAILKKGIELTPKAIQFLKAKGYLGVYIADDLSADIQVDEVVDQQLVGQGLEAVQQGDIGQIMNIAIEIVADIFKHEKVSVDLFDLRSYDDYTYHHSVNVGVYCAAVGRKMGLKQDEVVSLSLAAISHDLGKREIAESIIKKEGKLTDEEYEEIKKHSKYSFDILHDDMEIPSIVKQAVLMHHENEDGSGYPLGKKGKDIPIFAKIIHVMDVYDALTSKRPYKDPFAPIDAYEYIYNNRGNLFDRDVVQAMSEVVPVYPIGIDVTLSNGEEAIVMAHTFNSFRPIVKISNNQEAIDLSIDQNYKDIEIISSGIMPQDYVGDIEMLNEGRSAESGPKTVMIVDDDRVSRMVVREVLWNQKAYEIVEIEGGFQAIEYVKENIPPDLILMDISMPVVDGITAAMRIHEIQDDIPIIFLTGNADVETVKNCKKAGAIDYILKPAKPDYLKERVEVAFRKIAEAERRKEYLNKAIGEQSIT